jgi:RimJ/RimL family protein N-acetyltransferase
MGQWIRERADAILSDRCTRPAALAEVKAFAHPENAASRKVLSKAGFEEVRFVPAMNRFLYTHRLDRRPAFLLSCGADAKS